VKLALASVTIIGIAIGLAWPVSRPVAAPAVAGAPEPTVLEREGNGHFVAFAEVNGQTTRFLVDTGATTVALTVADARRAGFEVDPRNFYPVGTGASGQVRGQEVMLTSVALGGKRVERVGGVVLEGGSVSLLGQSFLRHLDHVEISGDRMTLR
jgi:aspartyl protease family protein